MRRSIYAVGILVLCLLLTACGRTSKAAWQEQYDLGVKYLSQGNYEEAIIAFTAAIDIDPRRYEAYIGRGDAYVGSGENLENAQADYEAALQLDDSLEEVYIKLADVLEMVGKPEEAVEVLRRGAQATGSADLQAEADLREEAAAANGASEGQSPSGEDSGTFDETYWHWNISPGNGGNFFALFHSDGTFSFVRITGTSDGEGTYTYDGTTLRIDGVEYVWDGERFSSMEKQFAMGAPEDGWTCTLTPDPEQRYDDLMGTSEENKELLPIDFVGMTVGELADRYGDDITYLDGWYNGAAKGFYYQDLRLPLIFYCLDGDYQNRVEKEDEIFIVEYFPPAGTLFFTEIAPGIPMEITYGELLDAGYEGAFYTGEQEWLQEMGETSFFGVDITPEVYASFYWYDHVDPYTTPVDGVQLYKKTS